eukprot:3266919-Amphidinium_carterae.1
MGSLLVTIRSQTRGSKQCSIEAMPPKRKRSWEEALGTSHYDDIIMKGGVDGKWECVAKLMARRFRKEAESELKSYVVDLHDSAWMSAK